MCAVCRQQFPKRELVRLVKTADGQISLDETGKKPGRGLYVCHAKECLAQAMKGGRLDKAAGSKVDAAILRQLKEKEEHETEP
jgi:predicted RNA-binding protein YlxR (DUF448 family)